MLSFIFTVGKDAESGIAEKLAIGRERYEDAVALPLANAGREVGGQTGGEKKPDVLLIQILEWYHERKASVKPFTIPFHLVHRCG